MHLPHSGSMSVDPATGNFSYVVEDVSIPCRGGMKLAFKRYYDSAAEHPINAPRDGWVFDHDEHLRFEYVGPGSAFNPPPRADTALYPPTDSSSSVNLIAVSVVYPTWKSDRFLYQNGAFVPSVASTVNALVQNADGTYTLTIPGVGTHGYLSDGLLQYVQDLNGNRISYTWGDTGHTLFPASITDPAGRTVTMQTVSSPMGQTITETRTCTDWAGRSWTYQYASFTGPIRLLSYTDPDGNVTQYAYGQGGGLVDTDGPQPVMALPTQVAAQLPPGVNLSLYPLRGLYKVTFSNGDFVTNYSAGFRPNEKQVGLQVFGNQMAVVYLYDSVNRTTTQYTGDQATRTVYQFDSSYRLVSKTDPLGNVYSYVRDANGNIIQEIDPRLGVTSYQYDSQNNMTQKTDALGNVTFYEYHPTLRMKTKQTGPVPGTGAITQTYDSVTGNRLSETDRLGHTISYAYNGDGQLISRTGKSGGVERYTYGPLTGDRLTYTDALGNVTTNAYDKIGRLISVTTPEGRVTLYSYTPSGLIASVTDPTGAVTRRDYDGNRNLVKETDPLGKVTTYAYNALNELTSTTDALGGVIIRTYTPKGELATVVDALGRSTAMAYDLLSRSTSVTDTLGHVTSTSYDPYCGTVTVTDPLGRISSTSRDLLCRLTKAVAADGGTTTMTYNADGTLHSQTDPLGNTATRLYDVEGQLLQVTDALGRTTKYAYTATGKPATVTDPRGNVTRLSYDLADRLVRVVRRDGSILAYGFDRDGLRTSMVDPRGKTWTTVYDAAGRPIAFLDPLGNRGQRGYDVAGRLTSTTTALGNVTAVAYDALGRPVATTDPLGNRSLRAYDRVGNLISTTDPMGRTTTFSFDALNRLVSTTDALGNVTAFTPDAVGNLARITDANGHATAYQFDPVNRVTAEIYADSSQVGYGYDKAGNLVSKADPRGYSTSYRYDAANQLTGITLPDSAPVSILYDAGGNVIQRQDATGTYSFALDPENRVTRVTEANGSVIQVSFDAAGNTAAMVYPDGRQEVLTHDDAGRVATLQGPDGGVVSYVFDADNRRTGIVNPNGVVSIIQYDAAARMTRIAHQEPNGFKVTADFRLQYDAVGNIVSVTDASSPLWTYGYDTLNRLTSAVDQVGGATTAWAFDGVGNRLTETVNGVVTNYTYNALNQLTQAGATTFSWDAAGNLAKKVAVGSVTAYTFDSRNRLVNVDLGAQHVSYGYDAMNRMVARTDATGTTNYEWLGWDLAREVSPTGTVTRYVLNGSEIAGFQQNDTSYSLHSNWLWSVRAVTDRWGTKVAGLDYAPYGEAIGATFDNVPGGVAMRFVGAAGVRFDAATGLHYMRNRHYGAALGRFVSRDPVYSASFLLMNSPTTKSLYFGAVGYNSAISHALSVRFRRHDEFQDLYNLYAYVANRPINATDPTGLRHGQLDPNCDCTKADPLPSNSSECDQYGDQRYAGVSLKCFCKCAGDGSWSQRVRGCLACEFAKGTPTSAAHEKCYLGAGGVEDIPWPTIAFCTFVCS